MDVVTKSIQSRVCRLGTMCSKHGFRLQFMHWVFDFNFRANEVSFTHTDVYKTKALVVHTGEVLWSAPVMWRVSCEFDITWFPLDKQVLIFLFLKILV